MYIRGLKHELIHELPTITEIIDTTSSRHALVTVRTMSDLIDDYVATDTEMLYAIRRGRSNLRMWILKPNTGRLSHPNLHSAFIFNPETVSFVNLGKRNGAYILWAPPAERERPKWGWSPRHGASNIRASVRADPADPSRLHEYIFNVSIKIKARVANTSSVFTMYIRSYQKTMDGDVVKCYMKVSENTLKVGLISDDKLSKIFYRGNPLVLNDASEVEVDDMSMMAIFGVLRS